MASPIPTPQSIMASLHAGRAAAARRDLSALIAARPRDPQAWVCGAWIELAAGNFSAMRAAIERASKCGAPAAQCDILRAHAANGTGDVEQAIAHASRAARTTEGAKRVEADAVLAESLFFAHRIDELTEVLNANDALRADPRGQLLLARVHRTRGRAADAEACFRGVIASNAAIAPRRVAGFELARILDLNGRYVEAFETAKATHAATGVPFDTAGLVGELEATASLAARGAFAHMPRAADPAPPTAFICALPRSGTTLIEQMLDRHPRICGVGELPAVENLAAEFTSLGGWPDGVLRATPADLARARDVYLSIVRSARSTPPETMTLDKTLHTWRRLPAVAAALPGAKIIRLRRDARDTAVSLFLSNMHRNAMGWNASLDSIKRVIAAERRWLPDIAAALGVQMFDVRYEDFVREPRGYLERTLGFLGLPWHDDCLAPEANRRVVMTLSHEQVRRPINADSIGRWQNYAEHFDASWDALNA